MRENCHFWVNLTITLGSQGFWPRDVHLRCWCISDGFCPLSSTAVSLLQWQLNTHVYSVRKSITPKMLPKKKKSY